MASTAKQSKVFEIPEMPQDPTGNPVFDFQAEHRVLAAKIQKYAILGGVLLFALASAALIVAKTSDGLRVILGALAVAGAVLMVAGLAWGYYWRKKLQRDFRNTHGSE